MDQTNIVIKNVRALKLPIIEIETTEKKYISNLSEFKGVHCFPKSQSEWENVSITACGFNITWGTRFEVHVDQIIDASESTEELKRHA